MLLDIIQSVDRGKVAAAYDIFVHYLMMSKVIQAEDSK